MSVLRRASVAAAFLFASALIAVPAGAADEAPTDNDTVVAIVNGEEVMLSTVLETLPAEYRENIEIFYPMALQQAVDIVLLRQAAERSLPADDPEVEERLNELRKQVLFQVYVGRELGKRVTDEAVEEAYNAYLAANPPREETGASHILLENEEAARAAIAELDGGADFATLAKERSTGPSGPEGGVIGYFTEGKVPEPFFEASAALSPGEYTKEPVETQFGWHVIMVTDRRMAEPAPLDELREQILEGIERNALTEMVNAERDAAEVEFFDFDGSPIEEEAEEPKSGQDGKSE